MPNRHEEEKIENRFKQLLEDEKSPRSSHGSMKEERDHGSEKEGL